MEHQVLKVTQVHLDLVVLLELLDLVEFLDLVVHQDLVYQLVVHLVKFYQK